MVNTLFDCPILQHLNLNKTIFFSKINTIPEANRPPSNTASPGRARPLLGKGHGRGQFPKAAEEHLGSQRPRMEDREEWKRRNQKRGDEKWGEDAEQVEIWRANGKEEWRRRIRRRKNTDKIREGERKRNTDGDADKNKDRGRKGRKKIREKNK